MNIEQRNELLQQMLETEIGGVPAERQRSTAGAGC